MEISDESLNKLWVKALTSIQQKLSTPEFKGWVETIKPVDFSEKELTLAVSTELSREKIEQKYLTVIKNSFQEVVGENLPDLQINLLVDPNFNQNHNQQPFQPFFINSDKEQKKPRLNPRYTFSEFVVGNSNKFAHAAALAVAESPAHSYNPLFIYGGVGLGKTHLMHAIGHRILQKKPDAEVIYASSEKFTNELINAIRDDKTEIFRQKYRNVDILLIDDIQFLAGKERTQEEFFHTFNTLYEDLRQIVLTSDRPPKDIPTLEDRLRSRFEWGLIADIQPPDLETRIAILRKKAENELVEIPDEAFYFIANNIPSNIRELEGALVRIKAFCTLNQMEPTLETIKIVLKDILPKKKEVKISVNTIQKVVAEYYQLKPNLMRAKKRTKEVVLPRQIAMYLSRELTDLSLPSIGEEFGGRDHTTIIHAYEKIKKEVESNPQLAQVINKLREKIQTEADY